MSLRKVPELLAPAGSFDAVRAAVANGANAVYLGIEKFNARDEGAQLSLDELRQACALAHASSVRIYLTLNVLLKPAELVDALELLGRAVDAGIDAVIVQDIGLVRLIQRVFPSLEVHGSTQMTVHDVAGARLMREIGIDRVVLARENTLDDVRAIRAAVPELGLETFIHGALCISYSGQCFMSGMISERSANRGSCAQSCRKDYALRDDATGNELDRGYLISAKDLAAHDQLAALAEIGVRCFKVEGRKKKPEYVATVTRGYREFLDRIGRGSEAPPAFEEVRPLVQIFSRGFTSGMYAGRAGRDFITRDHPDNRGHELGVVIGQSGSQLVIEVSHEVAAGDGLAFEPRSGDRGAAIGFTVTAVRTLERRDGRVRQAVDSRRPIPAGWRVVRSSEAALLQQARASFSQLPPPRERKSRIDVRVFGRAGAPLKAVFIADGEQVEARSEVSLASAQARPLDESKLREQLGRLGSTPFALGSIDASGMADELFLPVSELNRMRQQAVEELLARREWAADATSGERTAVIQAAVAALPESRAAIAKGSTFDASAPEFTLSVDVYRIEDALAAADGGATEIAFDPFLRHPMPPVSRVRSLASDLAERGVTLRLRTPNILRPEERRQLDKWFALGRPIVSGHAGLAVELASQGIDVVADYAVNCFNQHTAAEFFARGVSRIVASIELTADEIGQLVSPWAGAGFDVVVYGRPEGMTLEHCVLSAAFNREPTTCRDLCVQKHPVVSLTDPAGYTFPVATDFACRNRLLHSRPIEGSEFIPRLWRSGIRGYRTIFNVPGAPVEALVRGYRTALEALGSDDRPDLAAVRDLVGGEFTRGHFATAV